MKPGPPARVGPHEYAVSDFLMDGGVTAAYWFGEIADVICQ